MPHHEKYMQRCLQLAANGLGTTYPNPLVGSVIVNEKGFIIGEGWHYQSGRPHAEVNAIKNAETQGYSIADFKDATIYVNLEPCSHYGKTPPCASLIIKKGFKKVVVGSLDPHEKVAGKGCSMLKDAGITVITPILETQCLKLNRRFFTYHKEKRPYLILKWAETMDGFIAPVSKSERKPVWITNTYSRQRAHQLRAEEHGILVGGQTVIQDNPSLTSRLWYGNNPIRVVLDSKNNISKDHAVFNDLSKTITLNYSSSQLDKLIKHLFELGIQSIIIEGGTTTIQRFINKDLWDEAHQFIATQINFKEGIAAPKFKSGTTNCTHKESLSEDTLYIFERI